MPTFNPFSSADTLRGYLSDIERNDPATGNDPMQDFLLQQQASGVVPEFTDRLAPTQEKALDQFLIDTYKTKVETEVGIDPMDWDFGRCR